MSNFHSFVTKDSNRTDDNSSEELFFQLLWIILVASCAALVIQSLAANLGVVTGK